MQIYKIFFILSLFMACEKQGALPEILLDRQLTKTVTGTEAKKMVDRIHLDAVAPDENAIGFYDGPGGESIIYITFYKSGEIAEKEWRRMTEKISPENSVFIMGENLAVGGHTVYRCFGMGQTHFVFTHKSLLIWVSTETRTAKQFLKAYLDYLN